MKRILFFIVLLIVMGVLLFGTDSNVTRIGGWGTGFYNDVFTSGNYAYIAAGWNGLDIIDIKTPSKPAAVGNLSLNAEAIKLDVNGNYAYVLCSDGLHIVDVSIPASPKAIGLFPFATYLGSPTEMALGIIADGNYAYLVYRYYRLTACFIDILDVSNPAQPHSTGSSIYIDDSFDLNARPQMQKKGNYLYYRTITNFTLKIYDVSNPLSPQHKNTINSVYRFTLNGDYAYTSYDKELRVLNIANPTNPQQVGTCTLNNYTQDISAAGNYVYLAEETDTAQALWQIEIIDVSNPTTPVVSGSCTFPGGLMALTVTGSTALAAAAERGLYTFDISKPASPRLLKNYDFSWSPMDIVVVGDRAYVADACNELKIFDISTPTSPVLLGRYITPNDLMAISIYDKYAYVATSANGVEIIDVTNPAKPIKAGVFCTDCNIGTVTINGNYAYVTRFSDNIFFILDLTNPTAPVVLGQVQTSPVNKVNITGNYALLSGQFGVYVVDITNPSSPATIASFYGDRDIQVGGVSVQAPYVYVANNSANCHSLDIFDFSRPTAPVRIGRYFIKDNIFDLYVQGNYAYLAAYSGLYVIDVSHPASPAAAGYLDAKVILGAVTHQGKYIYLVTGSGGRFEILEFKPGNKPPQLRVNRSYLRFYADQAKNISAPQTLSIDTIGDNKLAWSLETLGWYTGSKIDWVQCSQTGGVGSAEVSISIDPGKVEMMLQDGSSFLDTGYISISAPNALDSGLQIGVSIQIDKTSDSSPAFGVLATPPANSIVSGSVPVTGWALDNIGVAGVQIYREVGDQLAFIGDAVFVEGARPDVEIKYPDYPNCFKAGWGYMLLTQSLPGGDGPLTLHAVATDMEGNQVTLGTTTVTVANSNSARPFGALDTPGQGETISGKGAINFGWALTPLPNTIPTDGSTIRVWIDGVAAGQPVYNQYRKDLAEQFPGLNNSSGAVGYFVLDTTKYSNGVHTIAWSVEDDAGNADGIGSRYFQVRNTTAASDLESADRRFKAAIDPVGLENVEIDRQPVQFKTGFHPDQTPETASVSQGGVSRITIHQLERVEVDLGLSAVTPGENISGYLLVGNAQRPLPIGSSLDAQKGIFYWQPGPGFVGTYDFIFVKEDESRSSIIKRLAINIAVK